MLIIFTGNGKGKTTAALGQALRAIGRKKKVLMVQFIKGPWQSGEDISVRCLSPNMKIIKKGLGFVGIGGDTLPKKAHKSAAKLGADFAIKEARKKTWDILILDEIWNALSLKLLSKSRIEDLINKIKPNIEHLIMTGRDCPKSFIKKADIATEMRELKHCFTKGKTGTQGLEF